MRRTARLLASVRPEKFLERGAPTGLCGLLTHAAPRPTLVYLYSTTLEKLQAIPPSSLYRQSVEGLTKHRLNIVESVVPAGYEEWKLKVSEIVKKNPQTFDPSHPAYVGGAYKTMTRNGELFVKELVEEDDEAEWDGDMEESTMEGAKSEQELDQYLARRRKMSENGVRPVNRVSVNTEAKTLSSQENAASNEAKAASTGAAESTGPIKLEREPPLTAQQISDIEEQIGAGLIEEVIEVAEGELKLVDIMIKSKVWEELEEKPNEGQWTYFSRDTATGTTQTPPQR